MAHGVPVKTLKREIIKSCGILSQAARNVGLSRTQVYKRISNNKSLQVALKESRERFIDKGESALVTAVDNLEGWAVSLLLRTLGRHRGYVEKSELDIDGQIIVKVVKFDGNNASE
jgi:sRNA-binding carbon storage regulator CsrA